MLKSNTEFDPKGLSPVPLAFVGDGVYELFIREKIIKSGGAAGQSLQSLTVKRVKASAQALAYDAVSGVCSQEEKSILKRGRNANVSVPKSCTPEQYHKATALEALFGYLYLKGEEGRLKELLELTDKEISRYEELSR